MSLTNAVPARDKVCLQMSCSERLPTASSLLDSPDSSKIHSTVGMLLSILAAPRQPWPFAQAYMYPDSSMRKQIAQMKARLSAVSKQLQEGAHSQAGQRHSNPLHL